MMVRNLAHRRQNFQDWFTQQWAIFWGKRIEPTHASWLIGPFGRPGAIADDFVNKIAEEQDLIIERNTGFNGLLSSIKELKFSEETETLLSKQIIHFYERTECYQLQLKVKWNPIFKPFGYIINRLFSNRIKQLNVPINNFDASKEINSEIIKLIDPHSKKTKYTVWYRTFNESGRVLYSGVYSTCITPSGQTCVKAVFPLPHGNATVIMAPRVGFGGELILSAAGKKFGEPGFYFLLNDSKGNFWAQYIRSFRDQLIVSNNEENIIAKQTLTLWGLHVVQFDYNIILSTDRS